MMETKWLYLILNAFTISIPFIRSFEPRIAYYKTWPALFKAIFIVGTFFVVWDIIFTDIGVWGFNPKYLSGIELGGLPLGEYLFFITVPYACVFIYVVLNYFWPKNRFFDKHASNINYILMSLGITLSIFYYNLLYTFWTFVFLTAFLAFLEFKLKPKWLGKAYRGYTVALLGFFLINGILTGTGIEEEVVWYNELHFVGLRMVTIPVEDTFYGLLLILMNIWLYEYFKGNTKLFTNEN